MAGCQTVVMTPGDETPANASAGQEGVSTGSTAVFTMREAAEVAGVSVSTLRRRRTELTAAGAVIETSGWQVPITALIATGLIPGEGHHHDEDTRPATGRSEAGAATAAPTESSADRERVQELERQVQDLTDQLHQWQRRAEVAEARAEERARSLEVLRLANESERLALRMLTTSTHDQTPQHPATTADPTAPAPPPEHASVQQQNPPAAGDNSARSTRRGGFFRRLFTD